MGNSWECVIEKEEIIEKVKKINDLTKKSTLLEFIGLYLEFSLHEDKKFSKKKIKVKAQKYNYKEKKIEKYEKIVYLTIEEFCQYYNSLMCSINLLFEKKIERTFTTLNEKEIENYGSDESSLCPICEENKVDISLPCSHFFCEDCIKSWVIKSETCPLCRLKLQYNKSNETPAGIKSSRKWSLLENDENTKQELKKDSLDVFLKLTKEYFNLK